MTKRDFGEITGKCPICSINLWSSANNNPVILPCNLEDCPYEDAQIQHSHNHIEFSSTGSGLAQLD